MDAKVCAECGVQKLLADFGKHASRKDGLRTKCKPCRREEWRIYRAANLGQVRERGRAKAAKYRAANPEKARAISRAYYARNQEKCRERSNKCNRRRYSRPEVKEAQWATRLEQLYGLTVAEYETMLHRQGGVCGVCGKPCKKRLSIDHCHGTGRIRGLLCDRCNRGLGYFSDDPRLLLVAADYLLKYAVP